ncbi:ribonuclease HI family protein [Candidatus Microgenomates bacterium]|nr:ribonuclease HI family protein [Candidatus Microgenomates bacterium]
MKLIIFCDGGARGNPGPAAGAFVVYNDAGNLREKRGKYLGETTNNVAEYQAVIMALEWLVQNPAEADFRLDSNLVVNQLNGTFKVKDAKLRELLLKVRELEAKVVLPLTYSYVPREKNMVADALVNQTLDNSVKLKGGTSRH